MSPLTTDQLVMGFVLVGVILFAEWLFLEPEDEAPPPPPTRTLGPGPKPR